MLTRGTQPQSHTRPERMCAGALPRVVFGSLRAGWLRPDLTIRPASAGAVRIPSERKTPLSMYPLVNSERVLRQHVAPVRCACASRQRAELHVA